MKWARRAHRCSSLTVQAAAEADPARDALEMWESLDDKVTRRLSTATQQVANAETHDTDNWPLLAREWLGTRGNYEAVLRAAVACARLQQLRSAMAAGGLCAPAARAPGTR